MATGGRGFLSAAAAPAKSVTCGNYRSRSATRNCSTTRSATQKLRCATSPGCTRSFLKEPHGWRLGRTCGSARYMQGLRQSCFIICRARPCRLATSTGLFSKKAGSFPKVPSTCRSSLCSTTFCCAMATDRGSNCIWPIQTGMPSKVSCWKRSEACPRSSALSTRWTTTMPRRQSNRRTRSSV